MRCPSHAVAQFDVPLCAQGDNEPVDMVIVLCGGNVHFAVFFHALHNMQKRIDTMNKAGCQKESFPHRHRINDMVLDRSQIRITSLHVQSVLIYYVVIQQPVGRAIRTL